MISFRPARRSEAKPLIGLYAESGAGKTLSALLLARGFVGPQGSVGMIETESGRGEAYADDPRVPGSYWVLSLRDTFSPRVFGEAIAQAEKESLDALIIDSASYEWDAIGGVRHMAAQNEDAGKKGMLVWQEPKIEHQRHFLLPLLSTPIALVILNMRARYPMEEHKGKPEKERWSRSEHLVPYQSDTILFELFAHGWIDREHRFHGTKWTRDELRSVLRDNERITLETGRRLAAWARGESVGASTENTAPGEATANSERPQDSADARPSQDDDQGYLAVLDAVTTPEMRVAAWTTLTVGNTAPWHHMPGKTHKKLLEANARAKARVGG